MNAWLIFWQRIKLTHRTLYSGGFVANCFTYRYQRFLRRFGQEWKYRKLLCVLMDIYDRLSGLWAHTLEIIWSRCSWLALCKGGVHSKVPLQVDPIACFDVFFSCRAPPNDLDGQKSN